MLEVREAAQVDAVLSQIEKQYGAPTILVNNAGITRDNLAMRMKDEEWDAVLDTNLKAVFRLCRAVMRGMMKARDGRIINISSVVGYAGNAGQANYCASKAGVAGMSRALARELGSRNITVNCVAPGFIDTDMTKVLEEKQRTALAANVPLGRLGQTIGKRVRGIKVVDARTAATVGIGRAFLRQVVWALLALPATSATSPTSRTPRGGTVPCTSRPPRR